MSTLSNHTRVYLPKMKSLNMVSNKTKRSLHKDKKGRLNLHCSFNEALGEQLGTANFAVERVCDFNELCAR